MLSISLAFKGLSQLSPRDSIPVQESLTIHFLQSSFLILPLFQSSASNFSHFCSLNNIPSILSFSMHIIIFHISFLVWKSIYWVIVGFFTKEWVNCFWGGKKVSSWTRNQRQEWAISRKGRENVCNLCNKGTKGLTEGWDAFDQSSTLQYLAFSNGPLPDKCLSASLST